MKKLAILLSLFFTIYSCQNKTQRDDLVNQFQNHTYDVIIAEEKDTITLDFKDSTYTDFNYYEEHLPWQISTYMDNDFLVLNRNTIALEKVNDTILNGVLISHKNLNIIFEKRKPRWDRALLNGIWVEEKNHDLYFNDSLPKPPPPIVATENKFQYPLYYEIKEDTILVKYYYQAHKSKIEISNSADIITMDLRSDHNKVESSWEIKELTDSIMIIDRAIQKENKKFSFLTTTEKNIKLIKKP